MDNTIYIKSEPLFLWRIPRGKATKIEIFEKGKYEVFETLVIKEGQTRVVYNGKPLQPGQSYTWQLSANLGGRTIKDSGSDFQIMDAQKRLGIASDLTKLEAGLKQQRASVEKIVLEKANYFAEKGLYSDALQQLYSVSAMHVSPTLRKVLDKATAYNLNERYTSAKEMIDAMQVTPLPKTVIPPIYNNPPQSGLVGGGGTFNTNVSVPPEIRGWNWGAFLLPGLWIFSNHVWIGLLFPFLLGAKGNVWAWKSRQWRSVEDFKAHQRAWAIAGSSVWGSLIGLFVLAVMVTPQEDSSTTPTLDTFITTTPTSEPFTTTPLPSLPPATTAKTQEVVIGNLQSYTDKNNLFSIDIPEGWTLTDKSQPGQAIVYWQDITGNALAQINVFAANGTRTKQEMVEILEAFLNKVVTANTNFSKSKPVFLADGTIRITWNNEVSLKGEKIRMTGNSYVEQHGDKLALYTIVVPSEQYAKLLPSIQQINAA